MKLLNSQNLLIASLLGFSTLVTLISSCNHYSPIYTNLVNLLQSEEWKEADVETYRVMLVVTKRQIEGWMRPEDVENIPCQDLRTIDQLWSKYSGGKFGFSVQQRIYKSLDGTKTYDENIWGSFAERIGWKEKDMGWLKYDDLNFSKTAPTGQLPAYFASNGYFMGVVGIQMWDHLPMQVKGVWFMSRNAECNI